MATFTTQFRYADDDEFTAVWAVLNSADASAGITVEDAGNNPLYFATNTAATAARAVLTTTVATTAEQEVEASVSALEQGTNSYVDIGLGAATTPATFATDTLGYYLRFHWDADGVRTMSLRHRLRGQSETVLETVTLVGAGGVEMDGYEGYLVDAGALESVQMIRLIATEDDSGVLLRGYVNSDDDDRPLLLKRARSDFLWPGATANDYGAWWFGTGATATARAVAVGHFTAADYDLSTDRQTQEQREDQVTLGLMRERVRRRYERGPNTNLDDSVIDDAIRDSVEYIINRLGHAAWFLHRVEDVSLSPNTNGEVTLPTRMREVESIQNATSGLYYKWRLVRAANSGAMVIALNTTDAGSFRVNYILRHTQIVDPTDPVPIPRQHSEALVVAACMRLAERDPKANLTGFYMNQAEHLIQQMFRDMARHRNAQRIQWTPHRRRVLRQNPNWGR